MEQPAKRDRARPWRTIRESQPSRKFSSTPPFDEGMKEILKLAKPSAHGRRPSMSDWVATITQAMITVVSPSSSSRLRRLEAAKMMKMARRVGAQGFLGTIDPV